MRCPSPSNLPFSQLPRKRKAHVSSLFTCSRLSVLGEKRGSTEVKKCEIPFLASVPLVFSLDRPPPPIFFPCSSPTTESLELTMRLKFEWTNSKRMWYHFLLPISIHSTWDTELHGSQLTCKCFLRWCSGESPPLPPMSPGSIPAGFRICLQLSFLLVLALPGGYFPGFFFLPPRKPTLQLLFDQDRRPAPALRLMCFPL